MTQLYPKRLIEVDLPIKRISEHARREKSIRHGHISTLHIWWGRRPLAACRAVICASLWPDPVNELCPHSFREAAAQIINAFAQKAMSDKKIVKIASEKSMRRWNSLSREKLDAANSQQWILLRYALLDFIADFANWDNSMNQTYLKTGRALTQAAHEALGGLPGTRPLVVDSFAGGGAIPLEALRVGADAFASDLNPVAVLLNKVVLEYIPRYGRKLADEVSKWGKWVQKQAEEELEAFYPKDTDGAIPIAYLWARTIFCEGPGCGAEVPLLRSLWLARRKKSRVALKLIPNPAEKRVDFALIESAKTKDVGEGTVARGSATCPCCGYTTPVDSVRMQLKSRRGGAFDPRLFAVVTVRSDQKGRFYRLPNETDIETACKAKETLQENITYFNGTALLPNEKLDIQGIRHTWAMTYGVETWEDLFTPRQALSLISLVKIVRNLKAKLQDEYESELVQAIQTCLALAISKLADSNSSLCSWRSTSQDIGHTFGRQAIPMIWDFAEVNVFSGATRDWSNAVNGGLKALQSLDENIMAGQTGWASATKHPLADDMAQLFFTDPPYYDAVAYAYLSDFFYVWLRRTLVDTYPELFKEDVAPKKDEIIVDRTHSLAPNPKDIEFYERELHKAFAEGCRILRADGIASIVFASKTTASWEAILQAAIDAGWIITGSWPIDTEMQARVAGMHQARLASSVHIVCRPRDTKDIGDWRDVLQELPERIQAWLPRLAREGVVGADAIFACLGPALEIFSRYSRVEKASGEAIELKDYLEHVWGTLAQEAMKTIFDDAATTDFEEDARLTAIWFWTMRAEDDSYKGDTSSVKETKSSKKVAGYAMEYDAARKLAQGLGVDLHKLSRPGGIVTIKGGIATLNGVVSRETHLVGRQLSLFSNNISSPTNKAKDREQNPSVIMKSTNVRQPKLFGEETVMPKAEPGQLPLFPQADEKLPHLLMDRLMSGGHTILDRLHQAMLLFGRSQTALLRPFLIETRMGNNPRFWRLARALSALYPRGSDEKRWVDGVIGRKKGLGF